MLKFDFLTEMLNPPTLVLETLDDPFPLAMIHALFSIQINPIDLFRKRYHPEGY